MCNVYQVEPSQRDHQGVEIPLYPLSARRGKHNRNNSRGKTHDCVRPKHCACVYNIVIDVKNIPAEDHNCRHVSHQANDPNQQEAP